MPNYETTADYCDLFLSTSSTAATTSSVATNSWPTKGPQCRHRLSAGGGTVVDTPDGHRNLAVGR